MIFESGLVIKSYLIPLEKRRSISETLERTILAAKKDGELTIHKNIEKNEKHKKLY